MLQLLCRLIESPGGRATPKNERATKLSRQWAETYGAKVLGDSWPSLSVVPGRINNMQIPMQKRAAILLCFFVTRSKSIFPPWCGYYPVSYNCVGLLIHHGSPSSGRVGHLGQAR